MNCHAVVELFIDLIISHVEVYHVLSTRIMLNCLMLMIVSLYN